MRRRLPHEALLTDQAEDWSEFFNEEKVNQFPGPERVWPVGAHFARNRTPFGKPDNQDAIASTREQSPVWLHPPLNFPELIHHSALCFSVPFSRKPVVIEALNAKLNDVR
jgi:hypothetical protein